MRYLLDNDKQREARRQRRLLDAAERRYARQFARIIAAEMRDMVDYFERTGGTPNASGMHERRVSDEFQDLAQTMVEAFGERIVDQGKALGLVIERKEGFAEFFQRLAEEWVGLEAVRRRITSIADTTRADIVRAIAAGQRDGLGTSAIAKNISDRVSAISRMRGALIARTETHGAANYGADQAARATGLKMRKEWVAAEDARTRRDHAQADGQIVDMDDPFRVGGDRLMYPGDPSGRAAQTINCRCSVAHVVDDRA